MIMPGVCRHCSCTDSQPCGYCRGVHSGCAWKDHDRIVCSNPACLRAELARVAAVRAVARTTRPANKYADWGLGAKYMDQRRQRERERRARRKRRAA